MRPLAALLLLLCALPTQAAERIVTLAPHLAELACAAGACDKLIGVVRYTNEPAAAAQKPLVGDALNLNYEQLLALKPDLILAWDGGTPLGHLQRLKELGFNVERIRIRSLRDIPRALHRIGQLADTGTSAALAVNLFYRRFDQLRDAHSRKPRVDVMYQIEAGPVYTVSDQSPISEAIQMCGGRNVFAALVPIAPVVGTEAILAADPQAVVFGQQDDTTRIRAFWSRLPTTTASKAGNLFALDANLLARQSPRLLDGIEQLCGALDQARANLKFKP